jgi:hypothetical protein
MIADSKNFDIVNQIHKDPRIEKFVFEDGYKDLTEVLNNDKNCLFEYEDGYVLASQTEYGEWDCHVAFSRSGREKSKNRVLECINYMFTAKPCMYLVCRIPVRYFHTKRLARETGFKQTDLLLDGYLGKNEIWLLSYKDWKWQQQQQVH